jgi:hypothetical protein
MCDNMRTYHLSLAFGLSLALCGLPARAAAKPQASSEQAARAAGADRSNERKERAPRAKTRVKKREAPPCFAKPVQFTRDFGNELETRSLSLTYCDGRVNPAALEALSVLARSRHASRPDPAALDAYQRLPLDKGTRERRRNPTYVTREIMRLHEGLLERLQRVANAFPGRALEVVSGHRPEARSTSRHHHGRALDFRVSGVTRERLRDFLRGFEGTGVGYYPNSTFVHMDVRDDKGYWVDRSGPGERPDYGIWPPPRREADHARDAILRGALADLAALEGTFDAPGASDVPAATIRVPPPASTRSLESANRLLSAALSASRARPGEQEEAGEDAEPGDRLTPGEVEEIRRSALKALAKLR